MNELTELAETKRRTATKKVSYSLDKEVVEAFNKIAKAKGYNKSRTVNNLIKKFLESKTTLL